MKKIFKLFLVLIPIVSILSVFKMYSGFVEYERNQKIKELLLDIKYKTSELKSVSASNLSADQLNSLYNINKRFMEITGKNFLESDLIMARDFIKKRKNKLKADKFLEDAENNAKSLEGSVDDAIIKGKFAQLQIEMARINKTVDLEEKSKRINETIEDIEHFKNELIMQRKVKAEGSNVLNGFNQISLDLDQSLVILSPLLKYKEIDSQLKDNIAKMYSEITDYQKNIKTEHQENFNSSLALVSCILLFLSLFVLYFTNKYYFNKSETNVSNEIKQVEIIDDLSDKTELKVQLEILKENLSQFLAMIDKQGKLVWSSRDFLNLFGVNDLQKLANKYLSADASWYEIEKTFIKRADGSLQIAADDPRKFKIQLKKLNSLKYDSLIIIQLAEDFSQIINDAPVLVPNRYFDLFKFCQKWVEDNSHILNTLNVWSKLINFKTKNEVVYTNLSVIDLRNLMKNLFEFISLYFITQKAEREISISVVNIAKGKVQIQLFMSHINFNTINDSFVKNAKVYPSISSSLRKMELDAKDIELKISLRNIYTKDRHLKGGMFVLEFIKESKNSENLIDYKNLNTVVNG